MKDNVLDYFGDVLMKQVRDAAIKHWDMVISGKMKDAKSREVYESIVTLDKPTIDLISGLVPLIVNTCLHDFLSMLEQQEDKIRVAVSLDDISVDDLAAESDGLAGELYGDKGWIRKFSKER